MSEKSKNAEKAKAKYHENENAEQFRKLVYRLKNGAIPTFNSMEKFNIDLNKINEIRSDAKLPPLEKKDIRGIIKEKYNNIVNVTKLTEVTNQPEIIIQPVKRGRGRIPKQKIIFDIETYISELGKLKITPNSQETYERMLSFLLEELGYTGGSIVPYLNKNFKHIQEVINKMQQRRNEGELYSLGSKKIIYQSVSSGLYKSAIPEFEKQMGKRAAKWWNFQTEIIVADVREQQREKTIINEPITNNWNDYKNKAIKFINDHNQSLEDRTFIQVYTLLGGVPRTNTFLNIHVVKNKNEATDPDKNYYITTTKTLISNNHKNGINDGKENGKAIIINLKTYPQILKNIESLSKSYNIIFNMSQNTASMLFTNIMNINNRDLRKLYTTHVYNLPADKAQSAIKQEAKIQAHSIDTAKSVYKMRRGGHVLILS
jgi:hypothetical protein